MKLLALASRAAAASLLFPAAAAAFASTGNQAVNAPEATRIYHSSILFMRTNWRAVDSSTDTVLYRVKPSGDNVVPLTPTTFHVDYRGGNWSPNGGAIVYEMDPQDPSKPSQLFVVDRQGGTPHQITTGPGEHTQASWGPHGKIAFVTTDSGRYCLGVVRADGTQQRILFCPPRESGVLDTAYMSTPQWTPSGKSVLIEVEAPDIYLEPMWYSRVYRVNVSTGASVKRTEQVFGDPLEGGDAQLLTIAPDGTHGIYTEAGSPHAMTLIDFYTGTRTSLATNGSAPRYSPDGKLIAFNQDQRVFVMRADGSDVHPAMANPGANAQYGIADWSDDGTRLLVNKVSNDRWLQIVTLATGAATYVTKGTADTGAWYRP